MATDGPTPPPCDADIFENGAIVGTYSAPSNLMERWVKALAAFTGERVDWHYAGGRAIVKALGDINKIRQAARDMQPLLELSAMRADDVDE